LWRRGVPGSAFPVGGGGFFIALGLSPGACTPMVSGPAVTVADLVPQNVLKGTTLECKQALLANVHDALFPRAAHWGASYCSRSRAEVDGAAALPLQGLFVQLVKHHDLAVKGMVVFSRREAPRCGSGPPPERHFGVWPNNALALRTRGIYVAHGRGLRRRDGGC